MDISRCFEILEINQNASVKDVQQQFRDLATVWHPDRFPTPRLKKKAEDKMKNLTYAKDQILQHLKDKIEKEEKAKAEARAANEAYLQATNKLKEAKLKADKAETEARAKRVKSGIAEAEVREAKNRADIAGAKAEKARRAAEDKGVKTETETKEDEKGEDRSETSLKKRAPQVNLHQIKRVWENLGTKSQFYFVVTYFVVIFIGFCIHFIFTIYILIIFPALIFLSFWIISLVERFSERMHRK